MSPSEAALHLFKGRHFDREIIVLCVRWYLSYKLSSRDLVEMMSERGIALAHTTILRWVQRYVPIFEKQWSHYARPVGGSWRCDETYIKVKGRWTYLYRAVDKQGRTVDFLLSERRDVAAAKRFFHKAMKSHPTPRVITLDAYAASHRAITELKSAGTMPHRIRIRSSKYLNNVVEQDHRRVKHRIRPMLGFKRFDTATITISGIELAQKIRKHQFKTGKLAGRPKTAPEIWATILAA
jgi:transposase-like protein